LSSIQVDSARLDSAGSVDASTAAKYRASAEGRDAASEGSPAGELAAADVGVGSTGDILGSRPFSDVEDSAIGAGTVGIFSSVRDATAKPSRRMTSIVAVLAASTSATIGDAALTCHIGQVLYEQGADSLVLGLIINEHGDLGGGVRQPLKAGHANDVAADQIGEIGAMESDDATFGQSGWLLHSIAH
jgi:hypothetical protein